MNGFDPMRLPQIEAWVGSFDTSPGLFGFVTEEVSLATAVAVSEILLPPLIEVRGCVLLRWRYTSDNLDHWLRETGDDHQAVEAAINHLHLWDLFEADGNVEEEALVELAGRIALSWRWKASHEFPVRRFSIEVTEDYGPTVVMSSERRIAEAS